MHCDDCLYANADGDGLECRRHAPRSKGWPETDPDSWCGEGVWEMEPGVYVDWLGNVVGREQ